MLTWASDWYERRLQRAIAWLAPHSSGRLLLGVFFGVRRHNSARVANAMAFDLFLSAIPMLAAAGWVLSVALRTSKRSVTAAATVLDLAPDEVHTVVLRHFDSFDVAVAPVALAGALWIASGAFHTLINVFEGSVPSRKRPWWLKRSIALGCVIGAILTLAASGALTVLVVGVSDAASALLGGPEEHALLTRCAALGISLLVGTTALATLYAVAISRPEVKRRVWPGAFTAVSIGGVASWIFAVYARSVARYALFYGSLAAVAIVLAWLWLWCAAVLLGAELNAQLEDRGDPDGVERESREIASVRRTLLDAGSDEAWLNDALASRRAPQPASPTAPTHTPKPIGSGGDAA